MSGGPAVVVNLAADLSLPQECSNVALALLDRNDNVIFNQSFNEINTRIRYREKVAVDSSLYPLRWVLVNLATNALISSQSTVGGSSIVSLTGRTCSGVEDRIGSIVSAYNASQGSTDAPTILIDESKSWGYWWIAFAIFLAVMAIAIYFLYRKQNTLEPERAIQLRS